MRVSPSALQSPPLLSSSTLKNQGNIEAKKVSRGSCADGNRGSSLGGGSSHSSDDNGEINPLTAAAQGSNYSTIERQLSAGSNVSSTPLNFDQKEDEELYKATALGRQLSDNLAKAILEGNKNPF
jgi:hypothetical protein